MTHTSLLPPSSPRHGKLPLVAAREPIGHLQDLLRLLGSSAPDTGEGVEQVVSVRRVHEGNALYTEGAPAEAFFFVRAGTFKTFNTGEDGYEQVLGFIGRGEALGFEAIGMGCYSNEAFALEESTVYVIALRSYFAHESRSRGLDEAVIRAISHALLRRGELARVMAAVSAEVRLARFLTQLSRQMETCGQSPRRLRLRMSRRDIASYLGVAHETISRSFGALAAWGLVTVDNREVVITDAEKLGTLARTTRRSVDEGVFPATAAPRWETGQDKAGARRGLVRSDVALH